MTLNNFYRKVYLHKRYKQNYNKYNLIKNVNENIDLHKFWKTNNYKN